MGKRSGVYIFFLFLFLSIIVLFQVLSMIQSDRLFERVNRLEKTVQNMGGQNVVSGGGQTVGSGISAVSQKVAREPNEGDWLVWHLPTDPTNLNPITSTDASANYVLGFVFEGLLEYDFDTISLKGLLAQSWSVSPDGLEITFTLKNGITFSDGVPVTADDVVFSFNTIKDPNVDAASLANYYANFTRVEKIDERTVKFHLKEKYFKSIEVAGLTLIMPKHIYQYKTGKEFNDRRSEPVGTGPYVFDKWDVGREIALKRNERYWGKRCKLDRIVYNIITNDLAAMQSLRAGNVDYLETVTEQFYELSKDKEFQQKYNLLKYWDYRTGYLYVGWNNDSVFFNDPKVRLAMTYTINREAIKDYIQKGLSTVIAGPFYMYSKQNDPNIKPWPFDPKKAAALLDEAGWKDTNGNGTRDKNGVEFKIRLMIVSGGGITERFAKLIKDDAAKVGIDIALDPYEWSVFIERTKNHQFDAVMSGWGAATPEDDPYQIFHSSQIANRGSNYVSFKNAEADKLLEEARVELDETKRNELYHRFGWILHEQQPYTFLTTRPHLKVLDRRFEGVTIHKGGLDEREWFVPKKLQKY